MLRTCLFLAIVSSSLFSVAQGNKNLYKQYRTGPDPDSFYHTWNYSLYGSLNFINSDQTYTKGSVGRGFGFLVQRLNSKTFGLSSGIGFNEIRYKYAGLLENSSDTVNWLSLPLSIRLYPSRKLFFEVGLKYHFFLNAKNSALVNSLTESLKYPRDSFNDTFGIFINIQRQVWKRLNVGLQYQYMKGGDINPDGFQPNIFTGFTLKISAFIKNPMKRPGLD